MPRSAVAQAAWREAHRAELREAARRYKALHGDAIRARARARYVPVPSELVAEHRTAGCAAREQRKRDRLFAEAFWQRVDRSGGPAACWPWVGSCQTKTNGRGGYGFFTFKGKVVYAHRRALEAQLGRPIRPGMVAMHACDNPPCANPAHLSEGTVAENNADSLRKKGIKR